MKTGFFVADHLLVGQLCTNPKSDWSLLSCLKVTQCLTSEIEDALLYSSCSLLIQVMTTGPLPAPSKYKSGRFNAWGHSSTYRTTLWRWWSGSPRLKTPPGRPGPRCLSKRSWWWNSPAVWWSHGAIRGPVADPECGSRIRRRTTSPKRPRLGFRRSATTFYLSLTGPTPSHDLNPLD